MSDELKELNSKDLIVFVPTLTTTIALCWQIGRLTPAPGSFVAFSLSDHIVGAATALPVALVIVAYLAVAIFVLKTFGSQNLTVTSIATISSVAGLIGLSLALWALWWVKKNGIMDIADTPVILPPGLALGVVFLGLNVLVRGLKYSLTSMPGLIAIVGSAALLSLTVSSASTSAYLERVDAGERHPTTVTTKAGVFNAFPIMSGERGLLTYDPNSHGFKFTRAEEISSVEWWPNL